MRTIRAKQIFEAIVRMEGRDPATAGLTAAQKGVRAELVNERIREGWQHALWPETLVVEQRRYRPTWDAESNWVAGDEVYQNEIYYLSLQDGNVNHDPVESNSAWWIRTETYLASIELAQRDATVIDGIDVEEGVFAFDPRLYRDAAVVRPVRILGDALYIESRSAIAAPWLKFRPPAPELSWTEWDAVTAFAAGDLRYLDATGESYLALSPSTNKNPYDNPVEWQAIGVPAFLSAWIKHAVASDLLQEDQGKYKQLAKANEELERLYEALIEQQGQGRRAKFR